MKIVLNFFFVIIFSLNYVAAETFNSALKRAYDTNPELNEER